MGLFSKLYVDVKSGSDDNSGKMGQPLKTIEAAQEKARTALAKNPKQNVTVYIKEGKYYLDRPLEFDSRDSAALGYAVKYTNYNDQNVRIIGGKPVTNWTHWKDGIYKAKVEPGKKFGVLFENESWAILARIPNQGYFNAAGGDNPSNKKTILKYDPADLTEPFDHKNANVHVWAGYDEDWDGGKNYNWYCSKLPVSGINWQENQITCTYQSFWNIHEHNRYYIEGALAFLDMPGEWCLDDKQGVVYYKPYQTPIEEQEIIIPSGRQVILVKGTLDKPVENLIFDGLDITVSDTLDAFAIGYPPEDGGAVTLRNARNITITNCRISNGGYDGIYMGKLNQEHTIKNNLIEKCGFCGITGGSFVVGKGPFDSPEDAYVAKNVLISNNYLRDCGRDIRHGSGMWFYECGDFVISHNLVENMPRYGINLLGGTTYNYMINSVENGGFGGEMYGQKITWENHTDFLCCRNNRIAFNEFRDVMKTSQDGGAIYSWGTGKGNVVENNYVHSIDLQIPDSSAVGIYMDDASHYFTVQNNVIEDIKGEKYHFAICLKGVDIVCENNIVYDCDLAAAVYVLQTDLTGFAETPGGIRHERVDHLVLDRNIYYDNELEAVYSITPWKDTIIKSSDYNIIYPADPISKISIKWEKKDWRWWTNLLDGKFEGNSKFADPMFIDAANGNFSFKASSPAPEMGFKPVDVSRMGLKSDFPFMEHVTKAE